MGKVEAEYGIDQIGSLKDFFSSPRTLSFKTFAYILLHLYSLLVLES